jgi:hypothetical protein
MNTLAEQVVLPSGATTHRLDEHMRVPASALLAAGNIPQVGAKQQSALLGVRPLAEAEATALAMNAVGAKPRGAANLTESIRVRHHAIARLIAAGRKKSEIMNIMGVAASTLSQLERSPAFQALVLEYMNMMDKESVESYTRLKIIGNLGMDELTRRLAEQPTAIKTSEVLEIVKTAADRTGMGPTSKQVTLNGRISPNDLRAIKASQRVVEAEYTVEDHGGDADGAAAVGEELEVDSAAEGGEEVREDLGEMVAEADEIDGLIGDLGSILGSTRGGAR